MKKNDVQMKKKDVNVIRLSSTATATTISCFDLSAALLILQRRKKYFHLMRLREASKIVL